MKVSHTSWSLAILLLSLSFLVHAQDGIPAIPTGPVNSTYSCNPATCSLPNCLCPSQNPPGGISPSKAPQFITITFDDSVQTDLIRTAYKLVNFTNPNGCPARGIFFVSIQYTDFSLVQQWYAQGHEVADHTFSHVGIPPAQEISACRTVLNTYGGVPMSKLQGFRAPFLNYTAATLSELKTQGFVYDSSSTAVTEDAYWPYTLDNGLANDCWKGVCNGQPKLPGLWEIPMHAIVDSTGVPYLMDPYLNGKPNDVKQWLQTNFKRHYEGGRQPFGIYLHPTHLTRYPSLPDPTDNLNVLLSFLEWATAQPDVWIVTNQQLLAYMRSPVPADQLAEQSYLECNIPIIDHEICNGLDDTNNGLADSGLLNQCNFNTAGWSTCFNCPSALPSVSTPTPSPVIAQGQPGYRYPVPTTCDSVWWDPIGNTCLCDSSSSNCRYKDLKVVANKTTSTTSTGAKANSAGVLRTGWEVLFSSFVGLVVMGMIGWL